MRPEENMRLSRNAEMLLLRINNVGCVTEQRCDVVWEGCEAAQLGGGPGDGVLLGAGARAVLCCTVLCRTVLHCTVLRAAGVAPHRAQRRHCRRLPLIVLRGDG